MKLFSTFLLLFLLPTILLAQTGSKKDPAVLIHFNYGLQFPGGDLKDDYGSGFEFGLGTDYFTPKNFIFGLQAGIIFGDDVKNDVIAPLRGPDSLVIGINRGLADIRLKERGIHLNGLVGKLFTFKKAKNVSGIRATLGMGLLQHKVRIQDDFQSEVPQLNDDYKAGYDQLTNGLALSQFIGYQYLAKDGLVNFKIGVEFIEAFTKNRRSWDFVENRKIDDPRLDLLYQFKVSWTLPLYLEATPEEIFY